MEPLCFLTLAIWRACLYCLRKIKLGNHDFSNYAKLCHNFSFKENTKKLKFGNFAPAVYSGQKIKLANNAPKLPPQEVHQSGVRRNDLFGAAIDGIHR